MDHVWHHSPYTGDRFLFHLALARRAITDRLDPDYHEQIWEAALPEVAQDARLTFDIAEDHLQALLDDGLIYPVDSHYPEHVEGGGPTTVYALVPLPRPEVK